MSEIKLGSLFDGSAGFPLAGYMYGITPVWASEVEPYPIRVTTKRIPFMKHYGDIGKMDGARIEPVDIITGGSPCQDMSVAGKREGLSKKCPKCDYKAVGNEDITECPECGAELEYTRSGLFMEQIRIIKEMREATNGQYPRYMVWENVPGALSSNKGADFRCVLEETARIKDAGFNVPMPAKNKWGNAGLIMGDDFSIGWRILDAQYWGVPQRRRRIFLVADFSGTSAREILFKREGLSWHFAQSRETWQTAPGNLKAGIDKSGGDGIKSNPIAFDTYNMEPVGEKTVTLRSGSEHNYAPVFTPTIYTMQIRSGCEGGGKGPLIQENKSATLSTHNTQTLFCMATQQGGAEIAENLSPTITAAAGMSGNNQPVLCEPIPIQDQAISNGSGNGKGIAEPGDPMYTLMAETHHGVAYGFEPGIAIREGAENRFVEELSPALRANMGDNQVATAYSIKDEGFMDYSEEISPCLKARDYKMPPVTVYSIDDMKMRNTYVREEQGNTLSTRDYKGPQVVCYSLQGNMIGRADKNGPQGNGINKDVNFTLNATDVHAVTYDCRDLVPNQNISGTLQAKNNGGHSLNYINPVVYAMQAIGQYEDKAVCSSLKQRDYKDATDLVFEQNYIVRRLIPLECARLQGFPDWWTANLGTKEEDITEEMMNFWREVFETHRKIVTGAEKPKTDKQIKKWLMDPDSDSAEYKMWGNGVALPCVLYVMEGIALELIRQQS